MSIDLEDDGYEDVRLKNAAGEVICEKRIDLWEVRNRISVIASAHKGKPALEYHAALVAMLGELGFPQVSHSLAAHLAAEIVRKVDALKKRAGGRALARLARFYAIDPFRLSPVEKIVLDANMDAVWAQEQLRDHGGRLKADMLGRLVFLATGDKKAAHDAWCKRVRQEQAAGDNTAQGWER